MPEQLLYGLRRLYAEAARPDSAGASLDVVRDVIGAEHLFLTRMHHGVPLARGCSRFVPADPGLLALQAEWLPTQQALLAQSRAGQPVRVSSFLPTGQMRASPLYQEVLRPLDGGLAAQVYWKTDSGWLGLTCCRSLERGRDFSDDDLRSLKVLAAHIEALERVHWRLQAAQAQAGAALWLLDLSPQAVLLLDARGWPMFVNCRAQALLGEPGSDLRLDARGLRARIAADDRALQAAIQRALLLARQGGVASQELASADHAMPLVVRRAPPRRPWVLTVLPAHGMPADMRIEGAWAAVLIHNAGGSGRVAPGRLQQAYSLTPREAELAVLLGQGVELAVAAERLAISQGTARQYLKQVFRKMEVQRQAELVQLLTAEFPTE